MRLITQNQWLSGVRWVFATFGPYMTAHGFVTSANWELMAGVAISLVPLIWGMVTHSDANIVATADALPQVAGVVVKDTPEGNNLAGAVPSLTVATAGTNLAKDIAEGG